jgi:tetratricopeptide (TPR) repeat protein
MKRFFPYLSILSASLLLVSGLSADDTWLFGKTDDFEIASSASERRTKMVIEVLQLVQAVFKQVSPNLTGSTSRRLRIIICKDDKTMDSFAPLYNDKPKELGGMFNRDFEGGFILINLDGNFESSKSIIYHEFIHFLSNNRKLRLPPWLSEGVAEVFSTIEPTSKNRVVLGNPPYGNVNVLRDSKMIPLERLFRVSHASPEYNSDDHGRGTFYAQSWALVHYFMFGSTDLPNDAYQRFIEVIKKEYYVSEERFIEIFGIGYQELEKRLDRYIRTGRYFMAKPDKPEIEGTDSLVLTKGVSGEDYLTIGSIRLSTRGQAAAAGYLLSAYESLPESADASAYMGYLNFRNEDYKAAAEYLSEAVEKGTDSPATHLWCAIAKYRTLNPDGSLTARNLDLKTTVEIMKLLFKARELGESRPELYQTIGRVWINSSTTLTEGNLAVIFEGSRLHRDDARIGLYLCLLMDRIGETENAKKLIDYYKSKELRSDERRNFEWLESTIEKKG